MSKRTKPKEPPAKTLEEAVRRIVRDELGRPRAPEENQPTPTFKDALRFLLAITVLVLALTLIPEEALKDERLKLLSKLVPWLASGLFFVGFAWFRDRLLPLTRGRAFLATALALLVVLVTVRFPIFKLTPVVYPAGARVEIDGVDKTGREKIYLPPRLHQVRIRDQDREASYELSTRDVLRYALTAPDPVWTLTYKVKIEAPIGAEIRFVSRTPHYEPTATGRLRKQGKSLILKIENDLDVEELPAGPYTVTAVLGKCEDGPRNLEVPSSREFESFNLANCAGQR